MSDSVWPQRRPTYYVLTFPLKFFEFINCIYHIFIVHSGSLEYFVFSLGFNKLHVNIDLAFQVMLMVKNLPASAADIREAGSIPGLGRSLGGRHGNPLQYSCLKNPMDRGAWRDTIHGVEESQTHTCTHTHTHTHTHMLMPGNNHNWAEETWRINVRLSTNHYLKQKYKHDIVGICKHEYIKQTTWPKNNKC